LGIVIDRHLRWKEHVDYILAKGMETVLALGRLAKSSYGLPLKIVRQLYNTVVLPRVEYGAAVWYELVRGHTRVAIVNERHGVKTSRRSGSDVLRRKSAIPKTQATTLVHTTGFAAAHLSSKVGF
jgi:hypothetical protein